MCHNVMFESIILVQCHLLFKIASHANVIAECNPKLCVTAKKVREWWTSASDDAQCASNVADFLDPMRHARNLQTANLINCGRRQTAAWRLLLAFRVWFERKGGRSLGWSLR